MFFSAVQYWTVFNNLYVTRPNALLVMPVQFLRHDLLPNKVTMTHLLKIAEEPVVSAAWKTSETKRAERETTVKYNKKFKKTAVICTECQIYCNLFVL
jgi:hypothetical protein